MQQALCWVLTLSRHRKHHLHPMSQMMELRPREAPPDLPRAMWLLRTRILVCVTPDLGSDERL